MTYSLKRLSDAVDDVTPDKKLADKLVQEAKKVASEVAIRGTVIVTVDGKKFRIKRKSA